MKKLLLISFITASCVLFGMDETSTNVAHLVEVPSENSLMYQKFNAVAAETRLLNEEHPYNTTNLLHCYDAILNRRIDIGGKKYFFNKSSSSIWNDLEGTNSLFFTSDNIKFTGKSVHLYADNGISYRTNGVILSNFTYSDLYNDIYKKQQSATAYICVEICFYPDENLTFSLMPNNYPSAGSYPNRKTLFNLGYKPTNSKSTYPTSPFYFTIDNDTDKRYYLNYYNTSQVTFSTLYGHNCFTNADDKRFYYYGLVNKYTLTDPISSTADDFIASIYSAASAESGVYYEPQKHLPPMTVVFLCSLDTTPAIEGESMQGLTEHYSTIYIFPHLPAVNGVVYHPALSTTNGRIYENNGDAYNGREYRNWITQTISRFKVTNTKTSYASFGGMYRRSTSYGITQNEFFYGDIYSIRIYHRKDINDAIANAMNNIAVDRQRFFEDLDQ